jgi:hypothetical protein
METVQWLLRKGTRALDKQAYWKPKWERISFLCDPRYYGKIIGMPAVAQNYTGAYKYADTLRQGCKRWADAVAGLTTPENEKWQRFAFKGADNYETSEFLDYLTDRVFARRYAMGSNFSFANTEGLRMLCIYGFSVMRAYRWRGGMRYKTYRLTDWAIDQNVDDEVDFYVKSAELNDEDLYATFGESARPYLTFDDRGEKKTKITQIIMRNPQYIRGGVFAENKEWAQFSIAKEKEIFDVQYSDLCDMITQKFETSPNSNDPYSLSPAMYAAATQETLNEMIRMCLKAANNQVAPVYLGHKANIDFLRFRPENYVGGMLDAQGNPLVKPMTLSGGIPFTMEWISYFQQQIEKELGLDLFVLFANNEKQMTATEIQQVARERSILQNGFIALRQSQFLEKEAQLNVYNGMLDDAFGDAPADIAEAIRNNGLEMAIQYDNEISRRMRMGELEANNMIIQQAGALAGIGKQQVLDRINEDNMLKDTRDILGAKTNVLKSDEEMAEIQKAKAEQARAEQEAQLALQAAQFQLEQQKAGVAQGLI